MRVDNRLTAKALAPRLDRFLELSGKKLLALDKNWDTSRGSPVITRRGKYVAQSWTEWTQGFQFGCQLLQFDATDDERFLELGRDNMSRYMSPHLSHVGVHDHGFNNVSTYGNLWRLGREGRTGDNEDRLRMYEMALMVSGAVQAARWTTLADGSGFVYSFNGAHSLFSDTIRSCRSLMLAHRLGHYLLGESDRRISLLDRALQHLDNSAKYNVYFGENRDAYDEPGRVVHESLFNTADGSYRCPSTQQGYSPFTTWTRGLGWILLGFAEQLEFIRALPAAEIKDYGGRPDVLRRYLAAARATADFYIANTALDGVPYWDTGAPGLAAMPDWRRQPSQPDNPFEPVDSSAAVIAAQGLLRLGRFLGADEVGKRYYQAGLTVARTLFAEPYLATEPRHQGLLRHSIYHRPRGWDYIPRGAKVPLGEASMWGDYHALELAVLLRREIRGDSYHTFWGNEA